METVKNKISDINTQIVICTKVEDIPSLRLFCNLTPKEYITDTFEGLRIMLEKGQLYIGLEEGYIESYDHKMDIEIDDDCTESNGFMMFKYLYVDNLTFAMFLKYTFSFKP